MRQMVSCGTAVCRIGACRSWASECLCVSDWWLLGCIVVCWISLVVEESCLSDWCVPDWSVSRRFVKFDSRPSDASVEWDWSEFFLCVGSD